jgi:hypothetical protein
VEDYNLIVKDVNLCLFLCGNVECTLLDRLAWENDNWSHSII